jgi:hypothetical protein
MTTITAHDRTAQQLRREIRQSEAWLAVDRADRRAVDWHLARIAQLKHELHELSKGEEV